MKHQIVLLNNTYKTVSEFQNTSKSILHITLDIYFRNIRMWTGSGRQNSTKETRKPEWFPVVSSFIFLVTGWCVGGWTAIFPFTVLPISL